MNHYDVTIRETLEVKMKVAANSREEAEQFARDQWKRGEVVLDANHFTGVEFHAKRYSRDRGERRVLFSTVPDSPQGNGM